jgi:putative membrane protein
MKLRTTTNLLAAIAVTALTACSTGMNLQTAIARTGDGDLPRHTISEVNAGAVAHAINDGEIQLSQLALTNASSQQVKDFAQTMINDHEAANAALEAKGFKMVGNPITAVLARDVNSRMAALRARSGADFDSAYLASQVELHQMALDTISSTLIRSAKGEGLRTTLASMQESVQHHLAQVQSLRPSASAAE